MNPIPSADRSRPAPRRLIPLVVLTLLPSCQQGSFNLPHVPLPQITNTANTSNTASSANTASTATPQEPAGGSLIPAPRINVATPEDRARPDTLAPPHDKFARRVPDESNLFAVEVPNVDRIAVKQKTVTTCWAACTQTLLAADHRRVDQTDLANKFRPGQDDQSANLWVIIEALCPEQFARLDKQATAFVQFAPVTSDNLIRALLARKLTIVGLTGDKDGDGHACVVYGAKFARATTASTFEHLYPPNKPDLVQSPNLIQQALWEYALVEVTLFDPFFDQGGTRTLSAADFARKAQFLINRPIAELMVRNALANQNGAAIQKQIQSIRVGGGSPKAHAPAARNKPVKENSQWSRPVSAKKKSKASSSQPPQQ